MTHWRARGAGLIAGALALSAAVAAAQDIPQGAPMPGRSPPEPASGSVAPATDGDADVRRGLQLLLGKPANPQEALRLFRAASDRGNAAAAFNIGTMHLSGIGVRKDLIEAARWYRVAAERRHAGAANALAQLYETGQGVPQDFAQAVAFYRQAADANHAEGLTGLGTMYFRGWGVQKDLVEAARLYRRAADLGNPTGQANLGLRYLTGEGVPQDFGVAYFWLNLAVAKLPASANALRARVSQARDTAAQRLAGDEMGRMQQLAASWQPGRPAPESSGAAGGAGAPRGGAPATAASHNTGTGIVVSAQGHVVTNDHVVGRCASVTLRLNGEPIGAARQIARDPRNDLALLKLEGRAPESAVLRDDRGVRPGDSVVVYGFPLTGGLSSQGNLTVGNVTALSGLGNDTRQFQMSAPVQPGNSGGPMLDAGGNVIGVVQSKLDALRIAAATGDIPQNVNFAIKSSILRSFLDSNGVPYATTAAVREMKPADIGDRARRFTVFVQCGG